MTKSPVRVILLPPHARWAPWTDPPDPGEPDVEKTYRLLAAEGWSTRRFDTLPLPWNPWARAHSVMGAIDPLRALRVLLLHRDTDLVIGFFESSVLIILLLRRVLGFRGRVVIYDVGVAGGWKLRATILRLVLPRADRLLPLGTAQVAGLVALGAPPGRVQPVRTATYPDFYVAAADQPDGYILAVGDDASRDYPTLLAACATLGRRVIIRSRLVAADPALPHVEILSHSLSTREYRDLIAGACCVVLPLRPSIHAGGVSTLLEAMSSAKAVIVSRTEGLAEYVADGQTCRLVPPGDAAALCQAIVALVADRAAREQLGAAARAFVVAECSPEAVARRLRAVWAAVQ